MRPRLCFRFDIDSDRCLRDGTRALSDVAARFGVVFTFFAHMGRATHRPRALADVVRRPGGDTPRPSRLSPRRKLGTAGTVRLLVANPRVGAAHPSELRRLAAAGHEVGLHGGRNHRTWHDDAAGWPATRLRTEMAWGRAQLARAGVPPPAGFSSPAWTTSPAVAAVAADLGFSYLADRHGPDSEGVLQRGRLPDIGTNVLGEPGGVGYLEWCRARGLSTAAVVADFQERLRRVERLAVVYDHPFWAGSHDADLVARLLVAGQQAGFEVVTLAQAVAAETAAT